MAGTGKRIQQYFFSAAAALITFIVYLPSLRNGFVNWDDNVYVYENLSIRSLDTKFFAFAFSSGLLGNWNPVTWVSYALDYAIWKGDPFGYHLTNSILHGLNVFLVVLLALRLLESAGCRGAIKDNSGLQYGRGTLPAALVTGLLFGLHPVHVESVAWISERKDVLSALFFLLSVLSYMRYVRQRYEETDGRSVFRNAWRSYLACLGLFLLALMSKPMAVTLPLVLLILDWYPLRRTGTKSQVKRIIIEKAPFFAASLAIGAITLITQRAEFAVVSFEELPFVTRVFTGVKAYMGYLLNMIYPSGLVPHYPYTHGAPLYSPQYLGPMAAFAVITALCIRRARSERHWLAVWSYYVITLMPVIGIIQIGEQSMADRYMYLPSIGPFLLGALCAVSAYHRLGSPGHWTGRKVFFLSFAGMLLCLMSCRTVDQMRIWESGETLWTHEIRSEPGHAAGYINRADFFVDAGRFEEAMPDIEKAAQLAPGSPEPFYFRGLAYMKQGLFVDAFINFTQAINLSFSPDFRYHRDRAAAYMKLAMYEQALEDYRKAISLRPKLDDLYYGYGKAYMMLGLYERAIDNFTIAIRLRPVRDRAYYTDRAEAYERLGRSQDAIRDARDAEDMRKE